VKTYHLSIFKTLPFPAINYVNSTTSDKCIRWDMNS
jgi:hypothetical protein